MPIDLADTDPRIVVHDRSGGTLPYSRGIMATGLLATGMLTEEAYRLAALVQARLLHHERHEVEAHELTELARLTLEEHALDPSLVDRWNAWRRARRTERPMVIVVGGAPGVGKSTVATRLAVRLGITEIITTDALREVLRLVVPPVVVPELHRSLDELVQAVPESGPDSGAADTEAGFAGFERQCDSVASAAAAVVRKLATERRSVIVEGVHLLPGAMTRLVGDHPARPIVVERLITLADLTEHTAHLPERDARDAAEPGEPVSGQLDQFDAVRSIQGHLIAQATDGGIETLDGRDTATLTQGIVDEIVERSLSHSTSAGSAPES